jgi:CBS domain-containing protein
MSGLEVIAMLTVRDAMTWPVVTVHAETPLKDVARVLIDAGVSGIPVVGADGAVVGVVSEADFLFKGQGAGAVRHPRLARLIGDTRESRQQLGKLTARTAGEAMTAPALTIEPTRSLQAAAARMTEHGVNRLPVVEAGRLVGIITRADLVRAYLRTDDELAATIRDDVLFGLLWLDPRSFTVAVQNGEATVSGHVDRRSTAKIVEETIAMVPGIIAVTVRLSWSVDDRELQPAAVDPVFPPGLRSPRASRLFPTRRHARSSAPSPWIEVMSGDLRAGCQRP